MEGELDETRKENNDGDDSREMMNEIEQELIQIDEWDISFIVSSLYVWHLINFFYHPQYPGWCPTRHCWEHHLKVRN